MPVLIISDENKCLSCDDVHAAVTTSSKVLHHAIDIAHYSPFLIVSVICYWLRAKLDDESLSKKP